MAMISMTAEEIWWEISMRVHRLQSARGDERPVVVPLPQWHEPDGNGCNWRLGAFGSDAIPYLADIAVIESMAQRRIVLIERTPRVRYGASQAAEKRSGYPY